MTSAAGRGLAAIGSCWGVFSDKPLVPVLAKATAAAAQVLTPVEWTAFFVMFLVLILFLVIALAMTGTLIALACVQRHIPGK